jgi:DNA-binding XRE family transcriptional regulator
MLRERSGITPEEMASRIWMNKESYYDLESYDDEWKDVVQISQLLELARILETPILRMIEDDEPLRSQVLSFSDLAEFIRLKIESNEINESKLGWDLSEIWESPKIALEYPVIFLQILSEDLDFDWRSPLQYYETYPEQYRPCGCAPSTNSSNERRSQPTTYKF